MLKRGYDFFFQFQRLAEQWLIDRDSEYYLILDMSAKQPRSPSMGSWQALFFCVIQLNGGKREATRSASQARGGAKKNSCQTPNNEQLPATKRR